MEDFPWNSQLVLGPGETLFNDNAPPKRNWKNLLYYNYSRGQFASVFCARRFFSVGSNPVIKFKYLSGSEYITITIVTVHQQTVGSARSKQITAMNLNLKCSRYYVKPSRRGSLLSVHDRSKFTSLHTTLFVFYHWAFENSLFAIEFFI